MIFQRNLPDNARVEFYATPSIDDVRLLTVVTIDKNENVVGFYPKEDPTELDFHKLFEAVLDPTLQLSEEKRED
jgi:hypothetical protein